MVNIFSNVNNVIRIYNLYDIYRYVIIETEDIRGRISELDLTP